MNTVQEALKAAIEALEYHTEQTRPIQKTIDAISLGKSALSEINKCESVGSAGEMPASNGGFSLCVFNAKDVPIGSKLYTSPISKEWLSLSEDEIVKIMDGTEFNEDNFCILEAAINYCKAIESALKQINIKG